MSRLEVHLVLPVAALLAVLPAARQGLFGQAAGPPASSTAPAASTPSGQAPARPAAAQAPAATPAPADPEDLGDSLSAHQRYQAAIAAYARAAPSPEVWNKMGIDYQLMFNLKDAMRCYKESLKLNPRNPLVMNNLGTAYDSLKEYKTAERYYRKALKLDPHSALIYKNLGTNLLAQHKYSRGWEAYQQALAIDPHVFEDRSSPKVENPASVLDRGAMNYYMARGCLRAGQTDCALQYLRMAINEGYITPKKLSQDKDFTALRGNPAFEQMLAESKGK